MAATFAWTQRNGTAPGTLTSLGISGNLFNYKRADNATAANYSSNPITAGQRSYEVWLRPKFTGSFNRIDNIQFWMSTNFSPSTGLFVRWKPNGLSAYSTPTTGLNKAVSAVPTSDPNTANVGISGNLAGSLAASGYTDYIITQLATSGNATPGDTSLAIFTLNYDEQ